MIALQPISPVDRPVRAAAPAATIYSFMPAGGTDRARRESRWIIRQLTDAIEAGLAAEADGRTVLLADFSGTPMNSTSSITCVDLTDANPGQAREAIRASDAVFVVSTSDPASIEEASAQGAKLQSVLSSLLRVETCGLLLVPAAQGVSPSQAEERTGLPVCGMLESPNHIDQLARWITQK